MNAGWLLTNLATAPSPTLVVGAGPRPAPTTTNRACVTIGEFVLNRKLFVLCFQRGSHPDDVFLGFICIE